jgi:hypothetical protein
MTAIGRSETYKTIIRMRTIDPTATLATIFIKPSSFQKITITVFL